MLRFLPLCVTGVSPGGLVAGIVVRGPEFGWANPIRLLLREVLLPVIVVVEIAWAAATPDYDISPDESRSLVDGRLLADALAGTWTVDRGR